MKIYKHNITAGGEIPGPPRFYAFVGRPCTLGVDPQGELCIWFEAETVDTVRITSMEVRPTTVVPQSFTHLAAVVWTGQEIDEDFELTDSCVYDGLVWHLLVRDDSDFLDATETYS